MWVALLCGSVVVRFLAAVTGGGDRLMIIIGLHLPLCYPDGVSLWLAASFFLLVAGWLHDKASRHRLKELHRNPSTTLDHLSTTCPGVLSWCLGDLLSGVLVSWSWHPGVLASCCRARVERAGGLTAGNTVSVLVPVRA